MEGLLKQSTAITITVLMIDSADHITGKTGLSAGLTITASKAGSYSATPITPTVTELDATNAKGLYSLALTTTHTNTIGELLLHITASGADPTDIRWQVSARSIDDLAFPATSGRSMVVDSAGLVDSNAVKIGPSGSGTAQTARDVGSSVLLSSGTGSGQLSLSAGLVSLASSQTFNLTGNLSGSVGSVIGNIGGNVNGSVASVTARVTANTDQLAGQTVTAAAGVTFPASLASPTNITAGTITTATNLSNAPTNGDFTATMKTSLNAATPLVTVSDKTGFELSPTGVSVVSSSVWDVVISSHLTAGSTGNALNAAGSAGDPWSTPLPGAYGAGTAGAVVSAVKTDTTVLMAGVTVTTNSDKTGYSLSGAAVQAIWDALTSALITVGSIGKRISDFITGDSYTRIGLPSGANVSSDIAAIKSESNDIKTKTDNIPSNPASISDIPTALQNANAYLKIDMSLVTGESSRSPLNAQRFLRNKWTIIGNVLTVYKEDDTTIAWTANVTTSPGADPITGNDPA